MKKITSILLIGLATITSLCGCMDDFDSPSLDNAYGNNNIADGSTITIAQLKKANASTISANGLKEITEETRIEGVIVGDDESGNIYKQLIISDGTGAIVLGINTTGIYAQCPAGQKIIVDCKGLYIGGYGKQAQIGTTYKGAIGRMGLNVWLKHVKIVGKPSLSAPELTPAIIDAAWLAQANKDENAPLLVKIENVTIKEANGTAIFAPDASKDGGNGVNRTILFSENSTLTLRTSAYANFAQDIIPQGKVSITGVLSRYNNSWQIVMRTYNDIK